MCLLMFVGASPGSTGGGVKTTTFYTLVKSLISTATGREARSFGRKLKDDTMHRAFIIVSLAFAWILIQTTLLSLFDPDIPLRDLLFEMVSGFSTTGLTTGITPTLSIPSKLLLILTMYAGRLGPLTIATLWKTEKHPDVSRPEEDLPIG
jgi:trk system potassium uptake protein TrkH